MLPGQETCGQSRKLDVARGLPDVSHVPADMTRTSQELLALLRPGSTEGKTGFPVAAGCPGSREPVFRASAGSHSKSGSSDLSKSPKHGSRLLLKSGCPWVPGGQTLTQSRLQKALLSQSLVIYLGKSQGGEVGEVS